MSSLLYIGFMKFNNIAAYKFVKLSQLDSLRQVLLEKCRLLAIKGTILLSPEGINLMLSAPVPAVEAVKQYFVTMPEFSDLIYKESLSEQCAFKRLFIKIKPEIITLRARNVSVTKATTGNYLSPSQFKHWLDAKKDMLILDTRNAFEIEYGTFENAVNLNLQRFTQFPEAVEQQLDNSAKEKPVVMFCTGGIRCEKAAAVMLNQGYKQVYQLEGGILNYFQHCGGAHYQGDCFVFDERIALDSNLTPIAKT